MTGGEPLHVLFGAIDSGMPGGIPPTEDAFVAACERTGRVRATRMPYGRRGPGRGLRRALELFADWFAYAGLVWRERPDVVHLNSAFDHRAHVRDLGYALVSRALGQPLFIKYHGSNPVHLADRSPFWSALASAVLSGVAGIGVLSSEERQAFAARWPRVRCVQVKNAVACARFAGAGWPRGERPELLFIARFVPRKGLLDCVRAAGILTTAGRALTLTCVGDGPERAAAEALVRELGLEGVVRFTGQVPEAEATAHYLRATMLVFPSESEGFSMTIFQSLAAGLPIVTTRIRAAADFLAEPANCLWVAMRDPAALADRVAWLLDHPDEAARMSAANRAYAPRFGEDVVAGEYLEIYASLARGSR